MPASVLCCMPASARGAAEVLSILVLAYTCPQLTAGVGAVSPAFRPGCEVGAMGKKEKDPVEKARRKLDKSQRAFHSAEEKHAQARARGRQEIEKARLRAARWQAKASELLERRAAAVARAEERL